MGAPETPSPPTAGETILGRDPDDLDRWVTIERDRLGANCYVEGTAPEQQTTLLHDWCVQWARAGRGFCYIHPRGPEPRWLLGRLPHDRLDDVVWIDYGRPWFPDDFDGPEYERVALNPFDGPEAPIDAADLVTDPVAARVSDAMAAYTAREDLFDWNIGRVLSMVLPWLVTDDELTATALDIAFSEAGSDGTVEPIVDLAPEGEKAAARRLLQQAKAHHGEALRWAMDTFGRPLGRCASNPLSDESTYQLHRAVANERIVLVTGTLPPPESPYRNAVKLMGTHLLVGTVVRRLWEALQTQSHEGLPYPLVLDGIPDLMSGDGHRLRELLEHGGETPLALVMRGPPPEQHPKWVQGLLARHVDTEVVCAEQDTAAATWSPLRGDHSAVEQYLEPGQSGIVDERPLRVRITRESGYPSEDPPGETDVQPAVAREPPPWVHSQYEVARAITASVERYGGIAQWLPEELLDEEDIE